LTKTRHFNKFDTSGDVQLHCVKQSRSAERSETMRDCSAFISCHRRSTAEPRLHRDDTVQTVVYQRSANARDLRISAVDDLRCRRRHSPGVSSHFPDVEALTAATPRVCASECWLLHIHSRELSISIFKWLSELSEWIFYLH